jgi:hypothetical protein
VGWCWPGSAASPRSSARRSGCLRARPSRSRGSQAMSNRNSRSSTFRHFRSPRRTACSGPRGWPARGALLGRALIRGRPACGGACSLGTQRGRKRSIALLRTPARLDRRNGDGLTSATRWRPAFASGSLSTFHPVGDRSVCRDQPPFDSGSLGDGQDRLVLSPLSGCAGRRGRSGQRPPRSRRSAALQGSERDWGPAARAAAQESIFDRARPRTTWNSPASKSAETGMTTEGGFAGLSASGTRKGRSALFGTSGSRSPGFPALGRPCEPVRARRLSRPELCPFPRLLRRRRHGVSRGAGRAAGPLRRVFEPGPVRPAGNLGADGPLARLPGRRPPGPPRRGEGCAG